MFRRFIQKRALAFANKIRAKQGREPLSELPKGFRGASRSCPIANAINGQYSAEVGVRGAYWQENGQERRKSISPAVHLFMILFDSGQIPELEK